MGRERKVRREGAGQVNGGLKRGGRVQGEHEREGEGERREGARANVREEERERKGQKGNMNGIFYTWDS